MTDDNANTLITYALVRLDRLKEYCCIDSLTFEHKELGYTYKAHAHFNGTGIKLTLQNKTRANLKLANKKKFTHSIDIDLSDQSMDSIFSVTATIQQTLQKCIETYGY